MSPSLRRSAKVPPLDDAMKLAFLNDSLVRFISILNPVLVVIALGWQKLRDRIDAVRAAATKGSGRKAYRLTDFVFVFVHRASITSNLIVLHLCGGAGDINCELYFEILLPRNWFMGPFNRLYFVVNDKRPLGEGVLSGTGRITLPCAASGNRDLLPNNAGRAGDVRKKLNTGSRAISGAPSLSQHFRDFGHACAIRCVMGVGLDSGSFRILGAIFIAGDTGRRFPRAIVHDPT